MTSASDPCRWFRHNECKPWAAPSDLWCDCPCHEDFD